MARLRRAETGMTLGEHLDELRKRLMIIFICVSVIAVLAFIFYSHLLVILQNPYCTASPGHCKFLVTNPLDGLNLRVKIAFFAGFPQATEYNGLNEIYISNIHAGNLIARFVVKRRVDVYLGYNITRDTGDGRDSAAPADLTGPLSLFVPVQTFPLSYQSPLVRISVRLNPKLRWNLGWQYYNYHEEFGLESFYQGYHANTGYSSVSYSF